MSKITRTFSISTVKVTSYNPKDKSVCENEFNIIGNANDMNEKQLLKAVSSKLITGVKVLEIELVSYRDEIREMTDSDFYAYSKPCTTRKL